jgi:predicted molibdopterin-dependent oxidoreductase YjgC
VAVDEARLTMEKFWGVEGLPATPGLTVTEMLNAAGDTIKTMYIVGENPMLSFPDIAHVRNSLEKLDFLVVQDIFPTDTTKLADVVLPAACWAEKDGTFTNAERRVQRIRKAVDLLGQAKADWKL